MRNTIIASAFFLISSMAYASSAEFSFGGLRGLKQDGSRISVQPTQDGKLMIRTISEKEIVEPKVLSDLRGTDGDLVLDLGKGRTLRVSSGFSPEGVVTYTLVENGANLKLNPNVFLNIK